MALACLRKVDDTIASKPFFWPVSPLLPIARLLAFRPYSFPLYCVRQMPGLLPKRLLRRPSQRTDCSVRVEVWRLKMLRLGARENSLWPLMRAFLWLRALSVPLKLVCRKLTR